MKNFKYLRAVVIMLTALAFTACDTDDDDKIDYVPAHRSAIFNTVRILITDTEGNNLADRSDVIAATGIYGVLSCRDIPFEIETLTGVKCIKFNADLPDERKLAYGEDTRFATGTSTMLLTVGKQTLPVEITFTAVNGDFIHYMYGTNAIGATAIRIGNDVFELSETDMARVVVQSGLQ